MTPLLSLQQTSIAYAGTTVLHDITLNIHEGERIAVIGPSGAGKSTLLQQLYQQAPTLCAWCPQELGLVGNLSLFHNIYMGRLAQHHWAYNLLNLIYPQNAERRPIAELIAQLELPEMRHTVDSLSGGQKQRVAIARALHRNARILIADEPVSALDDWQSERVLSLIGNRHRTVILALHDITQALTHCQRIIALKAGRIVLDADASTLTPNALQWVYD